MAQVSRRPLTAEARVRARINPCGICGGQSGSGTGFSLSSSVFPCQYCNVLVVLLFTMELYYTQSSIHNSKLQLPTLLEF
jgi:hypothetical protein